MTRERSLGVLPILFVATAAVACRPTFDGRYRGEITNWDYLEELGGVVVMELNVGLEEDGGDVTGDGELDDSSEELDAEVRGRLEGREATFEVTAAHNPGQFFGYSYTISCEADFRRSKSRTGDVATRLVGLCDIAQDNDSSDDRLFEGSELEILRYKEL